MKRIGILSDTHGLFDAPLRNFFAEVDEIWHPAAIGSIELAHRISAIKPLHAVYGNIDDRTTRLAWPATARFGCEALTVLMTHIGGYPGRYTPAFLRDIEQYRPNLIVTGHSHILKVIYDRAHDALHINPGAAGKYGFHKVRTAVRLVIDGRDIRDLEIGEWPK